MDAQAEAAAYEYKDIELPYTIADCPHLEAHLERRVQEFHDGWSMVEMRGVPPIVIEDGQRRWTAIGYRFRRPLRAPSG